VALVRNRAQFPYNQLGRLPAWSLMQLFGLLNLNKPTGITSRRLVDLVQRLDRSVKVGHSGTLDPLAAGVVVLGVGHATRLVEYLQELPKRYRGTFLLGRSSTTEDIEGTITELPGALPPTYEQLESAAERLSGGDIEQRPPAFSALKVAGRRAYDLAREGKPPDLPPRVVRVDLVTIVRYDYPELCLDVECGGGTYIRSLGRDLAELAGSAAVMSALVRTAVGPFTLDTALDPDLLTRYNLAEHLLDAKGAVQGVMEEITLDDAARQRIAHGLTVSAPNVTGERCAAVDESGRLVAILARRPDGTFRAAKNFAHAE
jgi:tRNA pseudouridine55 synthase